MTGNELEIKRKKWVFHRFNQPVPTVQLIKRTAEVNGAIIEEEWKNERGLGRVTYQWTRPRPPSFLPHFNYSADYYFVQFYEINA